MNFLFLRFFKQSVVCTSKMCLDGELSLTRLSSIVSQPIKVVVVVVAVIVVIFVVFVVDVIISVVIVSVDIVVVDVVVIIVVSSKLGQQ